MPQLDKLSFLNQLIWFFIFYIIFYFLMIQTFIPTIGRSLKLRHKLLSALQNSRDILPTETTKVVALGLNTVSLYTNLLQELQPANSYQATFADILKHNTAVAKMKAIYVKEMLKVLTKKKLLIKK